MIQMIIVDDEHIILESLKSLIDWKSAGVEVIGTADNGAAAIDLAIKLRPDIILSDISMPFFSGLEMLETLRRNDINTEVIFITAYGKFEYAQKAIHNGAFDYILKPIDEDLLLSVVSRCAAKIRTEQNKRKNEDRRHLDDLILKCLLQGKAPDKAEWDLIKTNGLNPEKFPNAFVIGFQHENDFIPKFDSADFHSAWISIPMKAEENLTLLMICFSDKFRTEWVTHINDCIHACPNTLVVISSTAALEECFEKAYAQISFCLIDTEIRQRQGMVFFGELEKSGISSFPGFDSICSLLNQSIREGRTEKLQELLYCYFTGFLEKEILYDQDLVELYCIELADHVYRGNENYINFTDANAFASVNEIPIILAVKKKISVCIGLHRIFNTLCEIFLDIYKSINKDQLHSSMRLVRQCIRIIHEQYGEDISLPKAAKQLYISSNYLSKIFSVEMEKSFSRYLLEYRITMAQKLLRETNDKVYEISASVGYADVVHFSKIFKQVTGLSPNRYRNQK